MSKRNETASDGAKNSDELRADLDQTRERVSSDVEALSNKLSPENLKAEAKQAVSRTWDQGRDMVRDKLHEGTERVRDKLHQGTERVRETVESTESSILGFVRENPIPLSLIGVGIGLLVWNSRQRSQSNGRRPDPSLFGRSEVYEGFDNGSSEKGRGAVGRQLEHLQDRVRSGVASVKHAASDTAQHARQQLGHLEQQAEEQAERAKAAAGRTFEERPLVLGAVALGTGLAIGLSIPATDSENQCTDTTAS